jgi:hypothetical protein
MLVIVSILVIYNEVNNKMNIAEIFLLAIALIAIIRASLNYIHLNNITSDNEHFTNFKGRKSRAKTKGNSNKKDNLIKIMSNSSKEYFTNNDNDNNNVNNNNNNNNNDNAKIDTKAVNNIDNLFKTSNFDKFGNANANTNTNTNTNEKFYNDTPTIPETTKPNSLNRNMPRNIDSVFKPEIYIGGGNKNYDTDSNTAGGMNTAYVNDIASKSSPIKGAYTNDNMTFPNTMKPTSNLWSSDLDKMDLSEQWISNLNSYNEGRWDPQSYKKPSDYIDYYTPDNNKQQNKYTSTLDEYGKQKKLCGQYDDLNIDQAGNINIKNYTQSKKWMPGYTYIPPVYWDVPQKHSGVCSPNGPNVRKLTGLVDRGLPLNVLELNQEGEIAQNENEVNLTNVGSILPRFTYQEEPYSKPFV